MLRIQATPTVAGTPATTTRYVPRFKRSEGDAGDLTSSTIDRPPLVITDPASTDYLGRFPYRSALRSYAELMDTFRSNDACTNRHQQEGFFPGE
jgi:hypothetical protein